MECTARTYPCSSCSHCHHSSSVFLHRCCCSLLLIVRLFKRKTEISRRLQLRVAKGGWLVQRKGLVWLADEARASPVGRNKDNYYCYDFFICHHHHYYHRRHIASLSSPPHTHPRPHPHRTKTATPTFIVVLPPHVTTSGITTC